MKLDDANIVKFRVAKEFCENKARINSIDFSQDGKYIVTSSDDDTIHLYDCEKGVHKREIGSKKYGADMIRYTHAINTAIHTSTKENDIIRYLSLHDNKYLRYFVGHEKRVVTLAMSPADDTFISGALDNTIRLWDLRQDKTIGKIATGGPPVVNFDPEGLIFAVGWEAETMMLYDVRHYDKGPFTTMKMPKLSENMGWKHVKFSPNGKQALITTDLEELIILDAFSLQFVHRLSPGLPVEAPLAHSCAATYTPDSQFILYGGMDGSVYVWSAEQGSRVAILRPERSQPEPVQCVLFNPKFMLMASACSKLSLWIPLLEDGEITDEKYKSIQ